MHSTVQRRSVSGWRRRCRAFEVQLAGLRVRFRRPALLDRDKHHHDEFTSGEPRLDEWLRRYAAQNRRGNTAAAWVIADGNHNVVCYATLSMTAIDRSASPKRVSRAPHNRFQRF